MKRILILLLSVIVLVSCNHAQKAYRKLETFTNYLENYSTSFTDEDWENALTEYSAIVEYVDAQVYGDEELVAIGKLKGRCSVQFVKYSINDANENINKFLLEADGFLQSIMDEFSN